jgi:tetratricopeptide (TPR) repeat protein
MILKHNKRELRKVVLCLVGIILVFSGSASANPLTAANELMAQGELQQGIRALRSAVKDSTLAPDERFAAAVRLAHFYADRVGDYPRAIKHYRSGLRISGLENADLKQRAVSELAHLAELESTHRELNLAIRRMKAETIHKRKPGDPDGRQKLLDNAQTLTGHINDRPTYYRIHEVYYTIGLTHLALKSPYRAYRAFEKALSAKPAMHLAQPISRLHHDARLQWIRTGSRMTAWILAGLLIGTLGVVGFRARPWAWVRVRHLTAGLLVILVWAALFHLFSRWLVDLDLAGQVINSDGVYPKPVFVHTAAGAPGAEVIHYLFIYGLVAICGMFLFCVATGRMHHRLRAGLFNAVFAIAFTGALATLYYLDHCDNKGRFYATGPAVHGLSNGYLAYPMSDPEPYLLVDPLTYQGLDLSSIDDPLLIEWLKSYKGRSRPAR